MTAIEEKANDDYQRKSQKRSMIVKSKKKEKSLHHQHQILETNENNPHGEILFTDPLLTPKVPNSVGQKAERHILCSSKPLNKDVFM